MNWRLATLINAAIALVTIITVVVHTSRVRHEEVLAKEAAAEIAKANRSKVIQSRESGMGEIAQVRVGNLGLVPPSEFYEILLRATPEEITALALKFNDLPNDAPTTGAIGMFFQAWAEIDGKSALNTAFRIKNIALKKVAAGTVIGSVSPSLCKELAIQLTEHPDAELLTECKGTYLESMLERWAYIDAPAAAKFFDKLADSNNAVSYSTAGSISRAWGTVDPHSALAWTDKQIASGGNGEILFDEVITGWCSKDIGAAAAYLVSHLDHPGASDAVSSVANVMLNQDPKGATIWMSQLPSGEAKTAAESSVASAWAQKDPSAAARWVEKLPRNDQQAAVGALVGVWAGTNWPEASKWVAGLSGDLRDEAITGVVGRSVTYILPTETLPLVLTMNNKQSRVETVQEIILQWARVQPEAAAAWVKTSPLSRQEKQNLLSQDIFSPDPASQ